MHVGSRDVAQPKSRFTERSDERLRQAARAHGGIIALLAVLVALRAASFVAFAVLLSVGQGLDPSVFRAIIIVDGSLSVVLDVVIVFVALMVFATVRRIENESDRVQVFMDTVYRRLP